METVYGAKSALVKAQEELKAIRELVVARDREVIGLLESRLPSVETQHLTTRVEAIERLVGETDQSLVHTLESRLEEIESQDVNKRIDAVNERIDAVEEAIIQLADRVGELPQTFRRDLEVSAIALGDRIGEEAVEVIRSVRSVSDALMADLREDAVEMVRTLRLLSETVVDDFKGALDGMSETVMDDVKSVLEGSRRQTLNALQLSRKQSMDLMKSVAGNVNETTKITAEALAEHLTSYLSQRDERLGKARDQLLMDLFRELGESLKRRDRRKLSQSLSDSQGSLVRDSALSAAPSSPPGWQPFRSPPSESLNEPRSILAAGDPRTGLSQAEPISAAKFIAEPLEDSEEDVSEYLRVPPSRLPAGSEPENSPMSEAVPGRRRKRRANAAAEASPAGRGSATRRTERVAVDEEQRSPRRAATTKKVSPAEKSGKSVTYRGKRRVAGE
jgi:hypothetical protein